MDVSLVHRKKALLLIVITLFGMMKTPDFPLGQAIRVVLSLLYNTPSSNNNSRLSSDTCMLDKAGLRL